MYRLAVEFPLFYGNEREDVREFIDNYSRAGRLNGWDEEKLALGLPLFLKSYATLRYATLATLAYGLKLYQVQKILLLKYCHKN